MMLYMYLVLIVPSGIETTAKTPVIPTSGGINCT